MPRSRAVSLSRQLAGSGLATVLDTDDFDGWQVTLASTLGHHRSELLSPASCFQARFRAGQLGPFGILHLRGCGRLRLIREQCDAGVLWLPLQGLTPERVNGQDWLAEPGTGLLFQPGDAMEGETSEEIEGISILIPPSVLPRPVAAGPPLLSAGVLAQQVLSAAQQLAAAAAQRPPGAEHLADLFSEALRAWTDAWQQPGPRERITARRRRDSVEQARQWMAERLPQRFTVVELSRALELSPRQLQYSFVEELGRTPMAEAKRLRLQRLRTLLLDPEHDRRSVAELMVASGLIASGVTSADYRLWCGESPRSTRLRRPA